MSKGTKIGAWVYGVQAFIVLPWFLGAIYRQEQSLWVWEEYAYALRKHGQGDALFYFVSLRDILRRIFRHPICSIISQISRNFNRREPLYPRGPFDVCILVCSHIFCICASSFRLHSRSSVRDLEWMAFDLLVSSHRSYCFGMVGFGESTCKERTRYRKKSIA